ncbi:hypothetical protein AVEN_240416-1 [Araneus ventricosus]|uniref:Uncharacterized protein n=1 Tax=Araneus ventricosus TaxID=182803 RepID=A0A4Y2H0L6_ARAVE|nr:hypothetical protein AVEN_240416-1 [Araneus ventricosus]
MIHILVNNDLLSFRNFHYPTLIECPWHNTNKLVKVLLADLQINFSPLDFAQIRTDGIPKVPSQDYTEGGTMKTSQPRSNNFRLGDQSRICSSVILLKDYPFMIGQF